MKEAAKEAVTEEVKEVVEKKETELAKVEDVTIEDIVPKDF